MDKVWLEVKEGVWRLEGTDIEVEEIATSEGRKWRVSRRGSLAARLYPTLFIAQRQAKKLWYGEPVILEPLPYAAPISRATTFNARYELVMFGKVMASTVAASIITCGIILWITL